MRQRAQALLTVILNRLNDGAAGGSCGDAGSERGWPYRPRKAPGHQSNQEDNLDNTDDESGTPLDDNTLLKEILEREVRIVVERIDLESNQEDNLDNTDDESGTPLDDDTLLKEILEREVRIVVERIDLDDLEESDAEEHENFYENREDILRDLENPIEEENDDDDDPILAEDPPLTNENPAYHQVPQVPFPSTSQAR
ncbi:hypothetical protein K1T71_000788 [Dendrolimus kikuchii]|uniref:Uncharacterized protein n=1 Tax=Dendrolimus kikuchii TaxID=765133 RepID=A0ACC1DKD5_9NEOP|nr:hypothetical protein K1T71_000788 [Dendrolimus kikuchii]